MENDQKRSALETYAIPILIGFVGLGALALQSGKTGGQTAVLNDAEYNSLEEQVVPKEGVELPVVWGDLGKRLIASGAIDERAFRELYAESGGRTAEEEQLLSGEGNGALVMTNENAGTILNLFWALGLANRNPILEDETEMMNPAYGGAGGFASTGGWTLARGPSTGSGQGDAMEHYNMHSLVTLTSERQALVEKVSKNIYRPCCGNSTHFPDCNHGMAMLGLLELMAS